MNEMQLFLGLGVPALVFYLIVMAAAILCVVANIFLAIGIKRDSDALGLSKGTLFMILTILLGAIPAVIYGCVRSGAAKTAEENAVMDNAEAKCKKASRLFMIGYILVVAAIALLGVAFIFGTDYVINLVNQLQ